MGGGYELFHRREKSEGASQIPAALGGKFRDIRDAYQTVLRGGIYPFGPEAVDILTRASMVPWLVGHPNGNGHHITMKRVDGQWMEYEEEAE